MSGGARIHEENIVLFLVCVLAVSIIYGIGQGLRALWRRRRQ